MKTIIRKFSPKIAFLGILLATANVVMAQTTTTMTTSTGTVREFSPDAFTVTTDSSTTPVRYVFSKTTSYVDESGNPVAMETVRSVLPVTVYYDRDGDRLVATKVVVKKSVDANPEGSVTSQTTATTTTSSEGTVSSFNPDAIAIQSDAASAPTSYSFSKTTTYVDESGNPVSIDVVKSGVPVTVYYDREGDRMVATRVVVKKSTTTTTEPNP
jgi:hypothetical protein